MTGWHDYISDFAWSHLGVEPADLLEITENHEVHWVLLWLLLPQSSPEKKQVWKMN